MRHTITDFAIANILRHSTPFLVFASFLLAAPWVRSASAQDDDHQHAQHQASRYVDHGDREIKALSPSDVQQLLNGEGMGLALPAELNGYPGPRHVVELADELELTADQSDATRKIYDAMHEQAVEIGRQIVDMERHLDQSFAGRAVTPETLAAMTSHIADMRGKLRAVHLGAHLEMFSLLSEAQRLKYDALRGYLTH